MSEPIFKAKWDNYNVFVYEHWNSKDSKEFHVVYYDRYWAYPEDTVGLGKFETESRARERALEFLVLKAGGEIL